MKILVTGASGFIGNYVVQILLNNGCTVIATSRNLAKVKHFSWYEKVKYIPFDLNFSNDKNNLYKYFDCPDKVIHLAWEGLPNYDQDFHITEILPKHKLFLNNLIDNGLKDVTISGTCLEYGMKEGCLTETDVCNPTNAYAKAKFDLYKFVLANSIEKKVNFKWIRLFYMFGAGQNDKSLISQLEKAIQIGAKNFNMSAGQQKRDFLPIESVASNIISLALQDQNQGIVNCCSGNPVSIENFVKAYLFKRGYELKLNLGFYPYTSYEPMSFWGDNTKLKNILSKHRIS